MARVPTWRQRRQHLRLIRMYRPSKLVGVGLLAMLLAIVITMFTLGGAPHSTGAPWFAVALSLVSVVVLGLLLTSDAASIVPGCAISGDHVVETTRLRIRPPDPTDADALTATIDDSVRAENGWTARTEREFVTTARAPHHLARDSGQFIIETTSGSIVGYIEARPASHAEMHIGWWITAEARGQGYATEAVAAMITALHDEGHELVLFGTARSNVVIQRVADRVGAQLIAETKHQLPNGSVIDSLWFGHRVEQRAEASPAIG